MEDLNLQNYNMYIAVKSCIPPSGFFPGITGSRNHGNPGPSQLIYISRDKSLVPENHGIYVKLKLKLQYIIKNYIIV